MPIMHILSLGSRILWETLSGSGGPSQLSLSASADASQNHQQNARAAFDVLQQNYNVTSGLYETTGWWNSANCLTVIGDLAEVDDSVRADVLIALSNSFTAAQNTKLQISKSIHEPDMLIESHWSSELPATIPKGFLNWFYDDEGWWALAWIQAYDLTQEPQYLQAAADIFKDMEQGATTPCGGIWWSKSQTYVNAVANELYLSVAAHLANRYSYSVNKKRYYLDIAQRQWQWFQDSGMINSDSTINDGLTRDCKNNGGTVWSYNQGVILSALVELENAVGQGQGTYLATAADIARAAISALSDSNLVLHDPCEPKCGADGSQFKGVFLRGLQRLQDAQGGEDFLEFIRANARSIWYKNRNAQNQLGISWAGPFAHWNAGTQSSALDALTAAVAIGEDLKR